MGSWFSKPVYGGESGMGEDPRPMLPYSSLQFLDIVLIRSAAGGLGPAAAGVGVSPDGIDARIAAAIRQGSLGLALPACTHLSKWDRVGLIQLPSFLERFEYDADNIEVTEATYTGVQTRSLRAVMEGAMEVAIRPLYVGRQIAELGLVRSDAPGEAAAAAADASPSVSSPSSSLDDPSDSGDANNDRLEYLQRYYMLTGALVNRPLATCLDRLEGMFRYVLAGLARFEVGGEETRRMEALLDKYVEEYTTQDGQVARGIPFDSMIPAFRDMSGAGGAADGQDRQQQQPDGGSGVLHTFTDAELYELVAAFSASNHGGGGGGGGVNAGAGGGRNNNPDADRVSLSNEGHVSKADFMSHWRASLERSMPLRRIPREILSGAFVTQALQHMGLLPTPLSAAVDSPNDNETAFLPVHFAMLEPPLEGWPVPSELDEYLEEQAQGGGGSSGSSVAAARERRKAAAEKSQKERERERQVRAKLREADAARWAHLPQLGPSPPPAADASAPADGHSSISVRHEGAARNTAEGLAVLHIHAHGVARIGIEHQLPTPPPQQSSRDDEARLRS